MMTQTGKKGKILFVELIIALLMTIMLLGPSMQAEAAVKYTISKTDRSKTYVGASTCKANVYFERVILKGKSSAVKKINKQIKKECTKFLKSDQVKDLLEYAKQRSQYTDELKSIDYYAKSKVTYNKKNIISIQIETFWWSGGVSNTNRYGMTFNLKNGKLLKLTDVCKGSSASIKKQIIKKLKKDQDVVNSFDGLSKVQKYKTEGFKFYLNKKGKAVVCFEPYEIAYGGWFREFAINSKYK